MKETYYYIIEESKLTNEEFVNGYFKTKEGVNIKVVPFTVNDTLKEEYIYTLEEWSNYGFDVIEDEIITA